MNLAVGCVGRVEMVAGLSITKRPMHAARDRPAPRDGGPSQHDGGPTNLIFGRDKASSVSTGMIEMAGTCRGGPNSRDISIPSITTMSEMVVEADLESISRTLIRSMMFGVLFWWKAVISRSQQDEESESYAW